MATDILAELRAKEEEMEALLNNARREAASIKEAALKSARSLREKRRAETDDELKNTMEANLKDAVEEARRIEEQGRLEAERLRKKGEKNFEQVVSEVMRFVREPHGERR